MFCWSGERKLLLRRRFTVARVSSHGINGSSPEDATCGSPWEGGGDGISGAKTCGSPSSMKSCPKGSVIGISSNNIGVSILDEGSCFIVNR